MTVSAATIDHPPISLPRKLWFTFLSIVGFGSALVYSLVVDLVLRLWVLPSTRKSRADRTRLLNRVVHHWAAVCWWLGKSFMRLTVKIDGAPPADGRYLILSNHQSSFDIPLLISLFPRLNLKFVCKESLREGAPFVSIACREGGSAFVSQNNPGKDLAELIRFAKELPEYDGSPLIFPEGTRTLDGSIFPFQTAGIEAVRRHAKLPIVLVTLDGIWKGRKLFDYYLNYGATVRVNISEPIPYESLDADPRQGYDDLREQMSNTLEALRK